MAFYRLDPKRGRLTTKATNLSDLDSLRGQLRGVRLEHDKGSEYAGIPPMTKLAVNIGNHVVTVQLWALSPGGERTPYDQHADRALRTLGRLRLFDDVVATVEHDKEGQPYPCFKLFGSGVRVLQELKHMSPECVLDHAEAVVRLVMFEEPLQLGAMAA